MVLAVAASDVAPYLDPESAVQPLADGRCRLVMGAWSWVGLAASIARLDADIEVVGPPQLTEAFAALARRAGAAAGSLRR